MATAKDRVEAYEKKKKEAEINYASTPNAPIWSKLDRYLLEHKVGFDTFADDYARVGEVMGTLQSTWHDSAGLKSAKDDIFSMFDRLNGYKTYMNKYGDLANADAFNNQINNEIAQYQSVIDSWDDFEKYQSSFVNADAFDADIKKRTMAEQYGGKSYDEVQQLLSSLDQNSEEYDFLSHYGVNVGYSDLKDYDAELESADDAYKGELQKARNQYALDNTFDLYKDLMENEDFEENSQYVEGEKNFLGQYKDENYAWINNDEARATIEGRRSNYGAPSLQTQRGYGYLTEDEKAVYRYITNTEGKKAADEFLEAMDVTLSKRQYEDNLETYSTFAEEHPVIASVLSVPHSVFGGMTATASTIADELAGKTPNAYDYWKQSSLLSADVRQKVGEDIAENSDWDIGGMDVGQFLYGTGMSMADSLVGGQLFGSAYAALMGTSAATQTAKDLTEKGEDQGVVTMGSMAAGASEMLFEYIGFDNLFKIKDVDSLTRLLTESLKQAGIEGMGELATEVSNIIFDTVFRGDSSEVNTIYEQLLKSGYSESEAKKKVAGQLAWQVGEAFAGGFVSGGTLGGVQGAAHYTSTSQLGKEITKSGKSEEVVQASMRSAAGREYISDLKKRKYTSEDITSGKISDAQKGELYLKSSGVDYAIDRPMAERSEGYDAQKKLAFYENYDSGQDVNEYADAFELAYEYGVTGRSVDDVMKLHGVLSGEQLSNIYKAGTTNSVTMRQQKVSELTAKHADKMGHTAGKINYDAIDFTNKTKEAGKVRWKDLSAHQRSSIRVWSELYSAMGINVSWFVSETSGGKRVGANGYYSASDNTIHVDVYAGIDNAGVSEGDRINAVLSHETTHWMKEKAPELYRQVRETVLSTLAKDPDYVGRKQSNQLTMGEVIANEVKRMEDAHPERKGKISDEDAIDELVARSCEDMLTNSEVAQKWVNELEPKAKKTLLDHIKEMFKNIREFFDDLLKQYKSTSEEAKVIRQNKEVFEQLSKKWDEMLTEAVKVSPAVDAELKEIKDADGETVLYSERQSLSDQIDDALAGKMQKWQQIYFGMTSDILQRAGLKNLPILYTQKHLRDALAPKNQKKHTHGLTKAQLLKIPEQLESPVMIMDSISRSDSVVVVTDMLDGDGCPIIAALIPNGTGMLDLQTVDSNFMTSIYGRENFNQFVSSAVHKGALIYANKNKTHNLCTQLRVQFPQALTNVSFDTIIRQSRNIVKGDEKFSDRYSDGNYLDAVNRGDMETAQKMVDDVAKEQGYTVHAYHGTARGDRVGNVFLPERATSGPMAFFTSDKTIAENYSKSKQDTSMAYDPDYDSYETQFRIKTKYNDMPLYKAWGYLPFDARNRITKKASQCREDWDGDNELMLDPDTNEANGGFQWQLKESRGNAIKALIEQWLNSGNLFNEESRFLDVLELTGVTEEFRKIGMDSLYFKDPNAKHEKVYDTFLKINNPFDTANVDEQFIADLEAWYEDQDQDQYVRVNMQSDMWDKNGIDAYDFAERLRSDIENNTTHAWTSIPDSVTDYLKYLGYDGIKDTGGKFGGDSHIVWIPFSSEQVKSAEPVTYDDSGNVIPLSERFDVNKTDIRYSDRNYSYDALVQKPDMHVTQVQDNVVLDRKAIIASAMSNVRKVGTVNENGSSSVYVRDIDTDVVVTKHGLTHGLDRRIGRQAAVIMNVGDVLSNTIRINEMTPRDQNVDSTYILLGTARNQDGLHLVNFVVNKYSNAVMSMDVLYSVDTKIEPAASLPPVTGKPATATGSEISIADLLYYVNMHFPDLLPESVLRHYGHTSRPDGNLGRSVLFSDRDLTTAHELLGENDRLEHENTKLKADLQKLKDKLKLERTITKGVVLNESHVEDVAKRILYNTKSDYSRQELVEDLKEVYSYIVQDENVQWDGIMDRASVVARKILETARGQVIENPYYKDVLSDIRKTRISLSETQLQELKNAYGSHYNRAYFGKFQVASDGIALDRMWQQWSELYPDVFNADVAEGDQIIELLDVYDMLRETAETVEQFNTDEAVRELAIDIYDRFWNVSTVKTLADKQAAEIKRMKFEHRKAMQEFKTEFRDKAKADKKAQRETTARYYRRMVENREQKIAEAKKAGRDHMAEYRTRLARKSEIEKITKKALDLNKKLVSNTKDSHIPEVMKEPVAMLIGAIDFSSERLLGMRGSELANVPTKKDIKLADALDKVRQMAQAVHDKSAESAKSVNVDENRFIDLPPEFAAKMQELVDKVKEVAKDSVDNQYVLNRMELDDLKSLSKMLSVLKHSASNYDKALSMGRNVRISECAKSTMEEAYSKGENWADEKAGKKIDKFLLYDNSTPYYTFKRFGAGAMKVFGALQDGWGRFAFLVKEIIDYSEATYTEEQVKQWTAEVKEFEVLTPQTKEQREQGAEPTYSTVRMTTAQLMSLYCLAKREQGGKHLFGGGISIGEFKDGKKTGGGAKTYALTDTALSEMISALTDEQKAVADKLQEFMNTRCAEWGNEVSMARFGIEMLGEKNYFPIKSDSNNIPGETSREEGESIFRLLNMSFTKAIDPKANNTIVVNDIFDVFASHTTDMAKYNTLALPVLDTFKWLNYSEKTMVGDTQYQQDGVKKALTQAYGREAVLYINQFLRDLNSSQDGGRTTADDWYKKAIQNYKIASIAGNLRVALLQPTAYMRAMCVIDGKYLTKALSSVGDVRRCIDDAESYCGIAQWKALGFYDTSIARGLQDRIKHNDSIRDKLVEASLKPAEWGDKVTWGMLWRACELEVMDKQKLSPDSAEFKAAVADRLQEVIYQTQVVDSTMTRSQMMRSKKESTQLYTAFMSEPTVSYNMLKDLYIEWEDGKRQGIHKSGLGKRIARTTTAYVMTAACSAVIEAVFDTMRYYDDEEETAEQLWENLRVNFLADLSVLNKIPIIKDLISGLQGDSATRMDEAFITSIYSAVKKTGKFFDGNASVYQTAYAWLKALSQMYGLPFGNMTRDVVAFWNITIGASYPSMKIK